MTDLNSRDSQIIPLALAGDPATLTDGPADTPTQEAAMAEELVTPENVSTELLGDLFNAALYKVDVDIDGELAVTGTYKLWVRLSESKRHLRFYGNFSSREGTQPVARLALANAINEEVIILRAAVFGDKQHRLAFDQYLWLDGGVTKRNIALAFKQFEFILQAAVKKDTANMIA